MESGKFDPKEQDKAWNSFKDGGRNGKTRTLATVYRMAMDAGWEHPAAKAKRERAVVSSSAKSAATPAPASNVVPMRREPVAPAPTPAAATKPKPAPVVDCYFDHQPNDLDLALRYLSDAEGEAGCPLVFDEGNLWHYTPIKGIWRKVRQADVTKHVHLWQGEQIINEKGKEEGKVLISSGQCRGAFWLAGQTREALDFFAGAQSGIVTADGQYIRADIKRGEVAFGVATPESRARAALPCAYDPEAKGDLLKQYLDSVHAGHPDAEARVQLMGEIAFVALMGIGPRFNKAVLCYGSQGTGKSVFLEILSGLVPAEAQCTIQPHEIAHEYYGAELVGKLLNVVTECNEAEVMGEAGFKSVISGEQITRRHIRGEPFSFRPRALHVFAGNKLPPAPGATDAFWVRWLPIGFDRTFRETDKEIKDLGARIVAEEMGAVLAWAVRCGKGLLERRRYTVPGCVEGLFKSWKTESDSVAGWLDEVCEVLPKGTPTVKYWQASESYKNYKGYCEENGFRPVNSRTFKTRLGEAGVDITKSSVMFYGIKPRADIKPPADPDWG